MASGRPDWYSSVALHGRYVEEGEIDKYITVNLDELGNMLALMRGEGPAGLDTIALDAAGNMKANLAVQSLPAMTVRPYYTEAQMVGGTKTITTGVTWSMQTIRGTGIIYGGSIYWHETESRYAMHLSIEVEEVEIFAMATEAIFDKGLTEFSGSPAYVRRYETPDHYYYELGIQPNLTFEDKIELKMFNPYGESVTVTWIFWYALIP